jgi:hypothetical protein
MECSPKGNAALGGAAIPEFVVRRHSEFNTSGGVTQPLALVPPVYSPLSALGAHQVLREIAKLRVVQAPLERAFWNLEQRIARLTDEIERRAAG